MKNAQNSDGKTDLPIKNIDDSIILSDNHVMCLFIMIFKNF